MLKKIVLKLIPNIITDVLIAFRNKKILTEIKSLNVKEMGVSDGVPWVRIKENNLIFYGFTNTRQNLLLFYILKRKIPHIKKDCFNVLIDIVERYNLPRSIPGESLLQNHYGYKVLRDPINDFNLSLEEKRKIANIFSLKDGFTCLDVGAYTGYGTIKIASRIGSSGRVFAFETDKNALKILRLNVKMNNIDNVTIVPKAASNFNGQSTFFSHEGTINSLFFNVLKKNSSIKSARQSQVDVIKIDDFLSDLNIKSVNYVNITVNGAEPEVIEGMSNTLRLSPCVSLTTPGWYVRDGEKIWKTIVPCLKKLGFKTFKGKLGRVLAWKNGIRY